MGFDVLERDSGSNLHFFRDALAVVLAVVRCVLNLEGVVIYDLNRPCITIYLLHSLNVVDSYEIPMLEIVLKLLIQGDFTLCLACDSLDEQDRQLLTCIKHLKLLTEIGVQVPIEP